MNTENGKIFLDRILSRIEAGEFDEHLAIPFASRKLLVALVESKMERKIETGGTPILSDTDIWNCLSEVRETAAHTTAVFLRKGILVKDENGIGLNPVLGKVLYPR
jgi:hypothetical protein